MTHNNERDEMEECFKAYGIGHVDSHVLAEALTQAGYVKPRQVTTVEELDALPEGTIIACVKTNPHYPSVFLRIGPARAPWLHLDPSDREDGESTMPSGEVLRWHGNGTATVLYVGSL